MENVYEDDAIDGGPMGSSEIEDNSNLKRQILDKKNISSTETLTMLISILINMENDLIINLKSKNVIRAIAAITESHTLYGQHYRTDSVNRLNWRDGEHQLASLHSQAGSVYNLRMDVAQ